MKQLLVISCPIDTLSGYGARSRDIALSIIKSNKYDVKILPQRWGNTPWGFLDENNPEHKLIKDCVLQSPQLYKQPDIWVQITVPNEFQAVGKYNIGITAGIETTICDPSWIEGCNRMNLVLTSSQHAKNVFEQCKFEKRDSNTQRVLETVQLKTKVEVLFEGVNTNIYKKLEFLPEESEVKEVLDSVNENFLFLFVGHWLQGDLGQDRKDVGMLVKTFLETFKDKGAAPALLLKTNGATFSILDKEQILEKIHNIQKTVTGKLPKIYLLHGEMSDEEINELYNHDKVKAMVSFTKGEGYGRPLLEFTTTKKPVIAPNYSGHLDFLKHCDLLEGSLTQIHPSAVAQNMLIPESSWFTVNYNKAAEVLKDYFKNYDKKLDNAKKQSYFSKTEFSLDKMQEKLLKILDENAPKQVELKLPTLKKIELPKLKKVE